MSNNGGQINTSSIATESLNRTRQACPEEKWEDLLRLLQALALLPEDSPTELLPYLTGWDSHSISRLASLAPEIIQSSPVGHCILRPPSLRMKVLLPPITPFEVKNSLQHNLAKRCSEVIADDSLEGSHCRYAFTFLVLGIRDPKIYLDLVTDSVLRTLRTKPETTPEQFQNLLHRRVESSLALHPDGDADKHILAAATLAESNRRMAERGDVILSLWQSEATLENIIPHLSYSLTESSVIELIATAEAAAVRNCPALTAKLVEACACLEEQLQENAGDAILGILKPLWGHRYAGSVVARLALVDTQAASAMHRLFLSAVKELGHAGPVFDYCARLLSSLDGKDKSFCREALSSTVRKAGAQLPTVSEHLARCGMKPSFDANPGDEEKVLHEEICRNHYKDAADILDTVDGKSRSACAPELRKHLNAYWKLNKPDASTRVGDIMTFFLSTGIMPKPFATMLRDSVAEVLEEDSLFWINDYESYRKLLRAAEYLVNEAENHQVVKLVIDNFLKRRIDEILLLWASMGDCELCAVALSVAFKVGDDYLKDTWDRMWKAAGKLRKMEGVRVRLAGLSLLLNHGSSVGCEWLNEHMIRQLLRLRISSEKKAALRASMQSPPVDGADYDRCLSILSSLKPIPSPVLGTIPHPEALARFCSSCVGQIGFHTRDMAGHLLGLRERFVTQSDENSFLRISIKNIPDPQSRRDILHAIRVMYTEDERAHLCLSVELRCPGTLRAADVEGVNLSKIDGMDFLLYAGVIMAENKEHQALLLSRLPSIREVSKRALLIHQYVEAEKCGPMLDSPPSTLEPLSIDRIACSALGEVKQIDLDTLLVLEQHLTFDLEGFRVLHMASQNVEGTLPGAFIRRQVERVFPSLRQTGRRQTDGTIDQPQSQNGFNFEDSKGLGEEVLRCGDEEMRIDLFAMVAQEISACGTWISVGFLDTANAVLRERPLEEPLLISIRRFPLQFEERYHSAFYGRLVRYLGDANQTIREELWSQASVLWFVQDDDPLKRVGPLSQAFGILMPEDTPGLYVDVLRHHLDELLEAARKVGAACLFSVLAALFEDIEIWLEVFHAPIADAFGEMLDNLPELERDVSEEIMQDFLSGLNDVTKSEEGVGFVSDVCSEKASRWEVFMSRLAGRRDSYGDLETWAQELSRNIVANIWPGDSAALLWIDSFKAGGGEDVMWLVKKFTHSMVKGPGGAKWADLCDELIDGAEPEAPPEEWHLFEAYCKHWSSLVRELHTRQNTGESVPFVVLDSEDYELFFLCMRDGPDLVEQKVGALKLFKQIFVENPEFIIGSGSSRVAILEMVGEVFADHPWKEAFAEAFLEVAEAESSIYGRVKFMLLAASSLRSATVLRGICDLLTDKNLAECILGATKDDLAFAIRVGTVFQFRSLYPTIDSENMEASEDLALLQKQAHAYRMYVLNEVQIDGIEELAWTSAQAFKEGSKWAQYFASAAEVCLQDASPAKIPIPYWWRIARCARLTGSPHLLQLLCRLRNACAPNTPIPPEVEHEVLSVLVDYVETPQFPELYGYVHSFRVGPSESGDDSHNRFLAEIPLRLSRACDSLT
ncbi:hypothetical protein PDESU_02044 [Pontiella desulfatans]|uniref:Uncharacterized protein n=1 Tax=Pontiella desulfatans TaxID=2750659 RepID=A0A6C2U0T5_PONDE|nr:hypothetical protein [Pontiella desulfatans]VGO13487.1 hypothetical protein PDESU_02044 [Pontiella desulfatans]